MNPKITILAIASLSIFLVVGQQQAYASSPGLRVNVHIDNNEGRAFNAEIVGFTINNNRETSENAFLDQGSNEVQIEYVKGVIENGEQFRVCVYADGIDAKCATGTNGPEKRPENVFITLGSGNNGNNNNNNFGSSSAASSSTASSSSSSSATICLLC